MARKSKSSGTADDNALIETVSRSAHQIWQAGLGAFAKAQEEGEEIFTKLAEEGAQLQKRTRHLTGDKIFGMPETVSKLAGKVGKQASGSWEKLEKLFEDRVTRSMHSLGVPTQSDIKALSKQIDELKKSVDALAGKQKAAPKTRATKAAAKRPAVKSPVAGGAKKPAKTTTLHH